ncbi:single-stranded-DNA-specific exonuclease RecJ [Paraglaciecola agarilytica]|uniref:Single-stranded-DNA-specific exonuclease RecJ n=1 Tax=Paraglaciecola chathamensis TaxID=368405 RepID=A0ABS0WFJ8_9ALTE|nr:single-stranded-DNA-specific exonuclease RecJ [Paraglaciecola agarilytica]MBJ2137233.1 single-stranded-DNA-specific exonuclease RecJ [Paraglaciecola chathamensis]MBU3018301.1 single-stranded-DNA-specific exonuclease RecJ [Paraglaciecola agarilytica]
MQIRRRSPVSVEHLPDSINPTLKQIYATRGITSEQQLERSAKALLHYKDMSGVGDAVRILADALAQSKRIIIVGDFDADGATSTALSMLALGMMGCKNHDYLVPNRFNFGYGLSPQIVDVAHEQGAQVIMTVDNGIACFAGVERAKELGITVLITDHHLAAETLPIADAIVNPNQPNCSFMSKNLAGVGVAFYLMLALRAHLRGVDWFAQNDIDVPNLADLLDIVALGTVADVVPLDENNRILVHQGLLRIRSDKCRPGIQALIEVAGRDKRKMVASDLGFVIGPRLNAAGRLDDMSMGIECLLTDSDYKAKQIAVELDSLNRERREIEQSMQQEAVTALDNLQLSEQDMPHGLVLYQADFHQGVIGILAGRIKEKYFRPTIAFAHQDDEIIKGSARSIPGVHIRDLLEELSTRYPGLIIKFGGHAMAAGLSIEMAKLEEFKKRFTQLAQEHLAGKPLAGELISDGELPAQALTLEFSQLLKDAGPWGQGFPEPLFDGQFELVEQRIVGHKHLKMMLRMPTGKLVDAIAFNVDTQVWPNEQCKHVELAYKLDINEFRGRTSLQFLVEGLNPL